MSKAASEKLDLYQVVTNRIIHLIEQGVAPWRNPIAGQELSLPNNLNSGRSYRGVNVFLLAMKAWEEGYRSPWWLTFKQAKERGGKVRRGEKSTLVIFWKQYVTKDRATGEEITVPVLRYFRVFNTEQCEGMSVPEESLAERPQVEALPACQTIVDGFPLPPTIHYGGSQAFYRPTEDLVSVPELSSFSSTKEGYATLFHELAHATGHSTRLDRGLDRKLRPFGSPDYSREELIAEMTAAFLCAESGITPATIENQAAYLQGWLKKLKAESRLVIVAAGSAQRAADWVLGRNTDK